MLQDQQAEVERFSGAVSRGPSGDDGCSNVTDDSTSQGQDPEAGLADRAGGSSLSRQSSALTWSQRQQLRRTSAAVRSAAASRHVAPVQNRGLPGCSPPSLLVILPPQTAMMQLMCARSVVSVPLSVKVSGRLMGT